MPQSHAPLAKLLRIAAVAALAITPALAVDVTYSTTGSFGGLNPFVGPQELSITYVGQTNTMVPVNPPPFGAATFGVFDTIGPRPGHTDPVSTPFTLTVSESTPSSGTQTLDANLSGNITVNSSTVTLTFNGGGGPGVPVLGVNPITSAAAYSFTIGGTTFWVDQTTSINPSVPSGGCTVVSNYPCGTTPLDGAIAESTVPEPTFYGLVAVGFAGLLAMAIRRRQQQTQA